MQIKIGNSIFKLEDIKKLYPAALVKTGYRDELTEVSLEWIDTEAKNKVEIDSYGIFIILKNQQKFSFIYENRLDLEKEISKLSNNLQKLNVL